MEEKVDGNTLGDESAEVQSPKRKVIRVESEKTQDYVRESFELELGGSRRNKFRAKRDQHPTKASCFGVTIAAVTKPSDFDSLLRW